MSGGAPAVSAWADRPARAALGALLALVVAAALAAGLAGLLGGSDAVLGVLLGATVPGAILLVTWRAAALGARLPGRAFAGVLVGSYVVKLVVVVGLLALLREVEGPDRAVVGATAVIGLALALVVEAAVISRTRAPYVEL